MLGCSLPSGLFASLSGDVLGRYWRRTLTKAVAARELSETVWRQPGDEAFICGLLQDLGMLLLIQELGTPYVRFVDKVQGAGRDLCALETESMGFDHTTLSARLLSSWGLPEVIVEAIGPAIDQTPPRTSRKALPQIVHLAELTARLLVDGSSAALSELLQVGNRYRQLSQTQLEGLVDTLDEKVRHLADVLSLQLPQGVEYRDVLVQAQTRLADIAADVAGDLLRRQQEQAQIEESLLTELQTLSQSLTEPQRRAARPASVPSASEEKGAREGESLLVAHPVPGRHKAPTASHPAAQRSPGLQRTGEDPTSTLISHLGTAVAACRQARCSLSLLLIEMNQGDQILLSRGSETLDLHRRLLLALCEKMEHPGMVCFPQGEYGLAVVLPDCERRQVVEMGNRLVDDVRRVSSRAGSDKAMTVSAGAATVALPPKNFLAESLFQAAARCLNGSRTSGGSVLKSIEIY